MLLSAYTLVREAYAAWQRHDLDAFAALMAPDVEFSVSDSPATYIGKGEGRELLKSRLADFLSDYEVEKFTISSVQMSHGGIADCRIKYHYRSRETHQEIEGTQRHLWTVRGHAITAFRVVHDAERLAAFFRLSGPPPNNATA